MNAQLNPDARVDRILTALRTTEPPAGLEARIAQRLAARLAGVTHARTHSNAAPSFFASVQSAMKAPRLSFAPAQLYTITALVLLISLSTFTIVHHRLATNPTRTDFNANASAVTHNHVTNSSLVTQDHTPDNSFEAVGFGGAGFEGAGLQSRHKSLTKPSALAAEAISSPRPNPTQDPDQLALAETLAPSRAAPLPPLTAQEKTLVAATRPGQPIQLAELDSARAPILRAEAEGRQNANIQRYVKSLLAPFAVADALQPTKYSEPREISTNASTPPPPTSSTN
jgi:hypothetical protein